MNDALLAPLSDQERARPRELLMRVHTCNQVNML
jgi:hypothetical protein